MLIGKLTCNKIFIYKTGWHIRIPVEIEKGWKLFLNFLKNPHDISFDQYLFADQNNFASIELHEYCDACKTALRETCQYSELLWSVFSRIRTNQSGLIKSLSIPRKEPLFCFLL